MVKGTNAVLCLTDPAPAAENPTCIRCGKCIKACPMGLQPLQLYLRRVLLENTVDLTKLPMNEVAEAVRRSLSNVQLKYAMIIFTTLPVLFAYPFFQKHFVKGIMVGSLKG